MTNCEHGQVRLAGSTYSTIGRVEVCVNGTWGTICSSSFDDNDASVVCAHLGYSRYGQFITLLICLTILHKQNYHSDL